MTEVVTIARCREHGLHGCRSECFVCAGPVEQVAMVPVEAIKTVVAMLLGDVELVDRAELDELRVIAGQCTCPVGFGHVADERCPLHGMRMPAHTITGLERRET